MRYRIIQTLRSNQAAIDLTSIMVGVIILSVIAGIIGASIYALISWSQDRVAKNILNQISAAQNIYMHAGEGGGNQINTASYRHTQLAADTAKTYGTLYQLKTSQLVTISSGVTSSHPHNSSDGTVCITLATDGTAYTAYSRSATNTIFQLTDTDPNISKVAAGTSTCVGIAGQPYVVAAQPQPTATPTAAPTATTSPTASASPTTPQNPYIPQNGNAIAPCTPNTIVVYTLQPNSPTNNQLTISNLLITTLSTSPQNWAVCIDSTQSPYDQITGLSSINQAGVTAEKIGQYWVIHNNPNISASLITVNISFTFNITFNIELRQLDNITTTPGLPVGSSLIGQATQTFTISTPQTVKGLWKTRINLGTMAALIPNAKSTTISDANLTLTHDTGYYYYVETANANAAASLLNPYIFTVKMTT